MLEGPCPPASSQVTLKTSRLPRRPRRIWAIRKEVRGVGASPTLFELSPSMRARARPDSKEQLRRTLPRDCPPTNKRKVE